VVGILRAADNRRMVGILRAADSRTGGILRVVDSRTGGILRVVDSRTGGNPGRGNNHRAVGSQRPVADTPARWGTLELGDAWAGWDRSRIVGKLGRRAGGSPGRADREMDIREGPGRPDMDEGPQHPSFRRNSAARESVPCALASSSGSRRSDRDTSIYPDVQKVCWFHTHFSIRNKNMAQVAEGTGS
jgi:hypothetical protein